jgi:hypothetical protein
MGNGTLQRYLVDMTITEAQKETGLLRQTIRYRMNQLAIYTEDISEDDLERVVAYEHKPKARRYENANREALVWEYYTKTKNNEIQRIARALCMSVGGVGYIINKIQKRKYIIMHSKMNSVI